MKKITDEETIAALTDVNKRLRQERNELEDENAKLEDRNKELSDELAELIEDASDDSEFVKALEQFADHKNWTGDTWTPVFVGLGEHPADMANRVLTEN